MIKSTLSNLASSNFNLLFVSFQIWKQEFLCQIIQKSILVDLEALLSVHETERYENFSAVIDKYGYLHKHSIQSVNEFDNIHNGLLDLLLLNVDSGPWLGLSKFDKLQSFTKDLRRLIGTLAIQHCIQVEKLNITGITMKRLEDEAKDLNDLLYETEFNKLAVAISTPLNNTLSQRFRTEEIRMDPLDEDLIYALLTDTPPSGISKEKFYSIRCIYEGITDTIGIEYKQFNEIIHCHQQRNTEQHELLDQYVR